MLKIIGMALWIGFFNGGGIYVYEVNVPGYTTQTYIQVGDNYSLSFGGQFIEEEPEVKTYVSSEYMSELAYNSEVNSWN